MRRLVSALSKILAGMKEVNCAGSSPLPSSFLTRASQIYLSWAGLPDAFSGVEFSAWLAASIR